MMLYLYSQYTVTDDHRRLAHAPVLLHKHGEVISVAQTAGSSSQKSYTFPSNGCVRGQRIGTVFIDRALTTPLEHRHATRRPEPLPPSPVPLPKPILIPPAEPEQPQLPSRAE